MEITQFSEWYGTKPYHTNTQSQASFDHLVPYHTVTMRRLPMDDVVHYYSNRANLHIHFEQEKYSLALLSIQPSLHGQRILQDIQHFLRINEISFSC